MTDILAHIVGGILLILVCVGMAFAFVAIDHIYDNWRNR